MNYQEYLASNHWKEFRAKKLKSTPLCRLCKSKLSLQVHHRRYKKRGRSVLFRESDTDVYVLCRTCHITWHRYFGLRPMSVQHIALLKNLLRWGASVHEAIAAVSEPNGYDQLRDQIGKSRPEHKRKATQ